MGNEPERLSDYFETPAPRDELQRLKHRRETWRAVGPGYPEWLQVAKPETLRKLDAAICELERERERERL